MPADHRQSSYRACILILMPFISALCREVQAGMDSPLSSLLGGGDAEAQIGQVRGICSPSGRKDTRAVERMRRVCVWGHLSQPCSVAGGRRRRQGFVVPWDPAAILDNQDLQSPLPRGHWHVSVRKTPVFLMLGKWG